MKIKLDVALVTAGFAAVSGMLTSCAGNPGAPARPAVCRTAIQFTGHEFSLAGLQVQSLKFQLGSAAWKTTAATQANDAAQALDVMQFGDCQLAEVLGPNDPQRDALLAHRTLVNNTMLASLKSFSDAKTPEEASKAVSDAQTAASSLAAKSPITTDKTKPPAPATK